MINFPMWVKTTPCKTTSRTDIVFTRHGVISVVHRIERRK